MGILSSILGPSLSIKRGPWPVGSFVADYLGVSNESASGVQVTEDKALSLSAIFGAVSLLSQLYGSIPLTVHRRLGRITEHADTHPAYRILKSQFNYEMSSMSARQALEWNRRLGGSGYAEIVWAGNNRPVAIYPLEHWRVKPDWKDDGLSYLVDGNRRVAMEDMIHVPLNTSNGIHGTSFMDYAADSLGLGISGQEFASRLFANDARPGGILKNPGNPPKEKRDEMKEGWKRVHGRNPGEVGLLWGGWDYQAQDGTIAPEQAQLLQSRQFMTEEAARWLGVPPFVLAVLASAGTVEQQIIQLLVFCLGPGLVAYEQEYDRKLLQPPSLFAKHNAGSLLRLNARDQSAYMREMIAIGVFSPNDCLELLDRNPVEGGDTHFFPLNMRPLKQAGATPQPASAAAPPTEPGKPPAPPPSGQPAPDAQPDAKPTQAPTGDSQDAAAMGDVQATALNGAQIASLLAIVSAVATRQMPTATAKATIRGSFPLMPTALIDAMIDPLETFTPAGQPQPAGPSDPTAPALRALFRDALDRMASIEANGIRRWTDRPGRFLEAMEAFYPAHEPRMVKALSPFLFDRAASFAADWCKASRADLLTACDGPPAAFPERIRAMLESWNERLYHAADTPIEQAVKRTIHQRDPRTNLVAETVEVVPQ